MIPPEGGRDAIGRTLQEFVAEARNAYTDDQAATWVYWFDFVHTNTGGLYLARWESDVAEHHPHFTLIGRLDEL